MTTKEANERLRQASRLGFTIDAATRKKFNEAIRAGQVAAAQKRVPFWRRWFSWLFS